MATDSQHDKTAMAEPPVDATTVAKPEEAHEKPPTPSLHSSHDADLEKQQPDDDMPPAEPVKSTTESVYPGQAQTVAITISLLLAVFLVALVRIPTLPMCDPPS